MLVLICICTVLYQIVNGKFQPAPKIVGGKHLNITDLPHSAALQIKCLRNSDEQYWGCGSSIVNQRLLLTAAHCCIGCEPNSKIQVSVGHTSKQGPNIFSVYSYLIHQEFSENAMANDIALVRLTTSIEFSRKVRRIALMKNPPSNARAQMAGWGLIDEINNVPGEELKVIDQFVMERQDCKRTLKHKLKGIICASSQNQKEYPSIGDSGSALVVNGYIQIGLVSFKRALSNLIYYTDINYFYDWIISSTDIIFCDDSDAVVLL